MGTEVGETRLQNVYENTTHITEDGYRTILRLKHHRQQILYRVCSTVLAVPFLGRLFYALILAVLGQSEQVEMRWFDIFFAILLLAAVWIWRIPQQQIQQNLKRSRKNLDLNAVNRYTFLPDRIQMLTTSTPEKFELDYDNLTWVKADRRWMILFFADRNFTMLIDRGGFNCGTAEACLRFLRKKIQQQEK